jgi:glycosyltransferase involved in cell wall biosynthesis
MSSVKRIGVAAVGDVLDINTWSNIPYFFYTTGRKQGVFSEPWRVDVSRFSFSRMRWNALQVLLGRGPGGFQYSPGFIEACERQIPREYFSSTVISFNQVFPRASTIRACGGEIYYYIDTTLHDLFREESYGIHIAPTMKELALKQEKENYANAVAVVSMGKWVHKSLADIYELPPASIHHILPGANIDSPETSSIRPFIPGAGIERDLILGFVGKDWRRKGLDFLLDVRDSLAAMGIRSVVRAIGNSPDEFKQREGFEYTGFINKQVDGPGFIDAVSSCDFGCLFSKAEALGISTLEFLRLGVPVMGFNTHGLSDTLIDGASLKFEPETSAKAVAEMLASVVRDTKSLKALKETAVQKRELVDWQTTIKKWEHLLGK